MKKIEYKKYKIYQLVIAIVLTAVMGTFVALGNFIIPLIVFAIAFGLMFLLSKNVRETLTDERLDRIAGKSAKIVLTVSVVLMAVAGIILISLRNVYSPGLVIGNILIYTECGMMLLYSILFKCYSNKKA